MEIQPFKIPFLEDGLDLGESTEDIQVPFTEEREEREGREEEGEEGGDDGKDLLPTGGAPLTQTPVSTEEDMYPQFANLLADKGFITDIPEGINPEEFSAEAFWKTMEYNMALKVNAAQEQGASEQQAYILNSLPPIGQGILELALTQENMNDEDIIDYIDARNFEQVIQKMNPDEAGDAENIIRRYYSSQGWGPQEITEKLTGLVESNTLSREAKIIHPKLVNQAQAIVSKKNEDAKLLAEAEERQKLNVQKRALDKIKTGSLYGIPISKEDGNFIVQALMNDDYQVPVKGGKKVTMTYADAMMYFHKNDPEKGDLDRVMLALLIMKSGPNAIMEHFKKQGQTGATREQVASNRFSNNKLQSGAPPKAAGNDSMFKLRVPKTKP